MWKHVVTKPQQRKLEGQEKWELQSPAVLEDVTHLSQIQVRKCERRSGLLLSMLNFVSKHIVLVSTINKRASAIVHDYPVMHSNYHFSSSLIGASLLEVTSTAGYFNPTSTLGYFLGCVKNNFIGTNLYAWVKRQRYCERTFSQLRMKHKAADVAGSLLSKSLPWTKETSEYCFLLVFQWGGNKSLLAVNSGETVTILNEQVMNAHYNHEVSNIPNNNYSWYIIFQAESLLSSNVLSQ